MVYHQLKQKKLALADVAMMKKLMKPVQASSH